MTTLTARRYDKLLKAHGGGVSSNEQVTMQGKAKVLAENKFIASLFIYMANGERYIELKTYLADSFVMGEDKYPRDLTSALAMLKDFTGVGSLSKSRSSGDKNTQAEAGVAMANTGD